MSCSSEWLYVSTIIPALYAMKKRKYAPESGVHALGSSAEGLAESEHVFQQIEGTLYFIPAPLCLVCAQKLMYGRFYI